MKQARSNCNAGRTTTQQFSCLMRPNANRMCLREQKREAREEEETKEGWRANAEDHYRSRDGVMSRTTAVPLSLDVQPLDTKEFHCQTPCVEPMSIATRTWPVKFIACLVSGYSADYHQRGAQEVCVYVRRGACFCSPSVSRADAQLGCSIVQGRQFGE